MDPTTSLVEQAKRHICPLISQGRMQRGDRLPSYRELGEQFGMAYTTIKFAMDGKADHTGEWIASAPTCLFCSNHQPEMLNFNPKETTK